MSKLKLRHFICYLYCLEPYALSFIKVTNCFTYVFLLVSWTLCPCLLPRLSVVCNDRGSWLALSKVSTVHPQWMNSTGEWMNSCRCLLKTNLIILTWLILTRASPISSSSLSYVFLIFPTWMLSPTTQLPQNCSWLISDSFHFHNDCVS